MPVAEAHEILKHEDKPWCIMKYGDLWGYIGNYRDMQIMQLYRDSTPTVEIKLQNISSKRQEAGDLKGCIG